MDSQHVKGFETLVKSPRQCFCDISLSLSKKIGPINTFLEVSETLRLSLTILTPDNRYILSVKASVWRNQFKCNYLKIKKRFVDFFLQFRNPHKILNPLKKKCSLRDDFLLKLLTGKSGVTSMPKEPPRQNTYGQSTF